MANTTITDLVDNMVLSTARRTSDRQFYDNIFKNRPFLDRQLKSKNVQKYGGREVIVAHMKSKNTQAKSYRVGDTFDLTKQDFSNAGIAQWQHIACPLVYDPEEAAMNSGPERIIPYVQSILVNGEESFSESINDQILVEFEAQGNGGADLYPMSLAISRDTTSALVYLGIDQSAESYHRNQSRTFAGLTTQSAIRNRLFQLHSDCTRGRGGMPTTGMIDPNGLDFLVNIQAAQQRNTNDMGFESVRVKGTEVFSDESIRSAVDGSVITTGSTIYFLNEKL